MKFLTHREVFEDQTGKGHELINQHKIQESSILEDLRDRFYISNDIIKCGKVCAAHGVNNICISSVLPFRERLTNSTINYINDKLAKLCRENSFDFLLNDNIIYDHSKSLYYHDGIHLNEAGRDILMDNFSTYLNPN